MHCAPPCAVLSWIAHAMPAGQQARSKLVIRNLPPVVGEETILKALHDVIATDAYDWVCYVPGKISRKTVKPSRLYVNLRSGNDVTTVAKAFQGRVFVNDKGAQYKATVEYAPFQRIPSNGKVDRRVGTIEQDNDYLQFCEKLEARSQQVANGLPGELSTLAMTAESAPVVTPLMQALIDKHTPQHLKPQAVTAVPLGPGDKKLKVKAKEARQDGTGRAPAKAPKGPSSSVTAAPAANNAAGRKAGPISSTKSKTSRADKPAAVSTSSSAAKPSSSAVASAKAADTIPNSKGEAAGDSRVGSAATAEDIRTVPSDAAVTAGPMGMAGTTAGASAGGSAGPPQGGPAAADSKGRRVRAGFQPWQPRRVGRLSEQGGS